MSKKWGRFYFFTIAKLKNRTVHFFSKAVTLVELIVAVTIVSVIILSIYNIDTYTHNQVINTQRRTVVQNELSHTLEHMGKYVQLANGNNVVAANNAIQSILSGFRVRFDFNRTPGDLNDDIWINYQLNANSITASATCVTPGCTALAPFLATFINNEVLTARVLPNFLSIVPADPLPANPPAGFYASVADLLTGDPGGWVEVVLVGRFIPGNNVTPRNPQMVLRSRLICNSCSTN